MCPHAFLRLRYWFPPTSSSLFRRELRRRPHEPYARTIPRTMPASSPATRHRPRRDAVRANTRMPKAGESGPDAAAEHGGVQQQADDRDELGAMLRDSFVLSLHASAGARPRGRGEERAQVTARAVEGAERQDRPLTGGAGAHRTAPRRHLGGERGRWSASRASR